MWFTIEELAVELGISEEEVKNKLSQEPVTYKFIFQNFRLKRYYDITDSNIEKIIRAKNEVAKPKPTNYKINPDIFKEFVNKTLDQEGKQDLKLLMDTYITSLEKVTDSLEIDLSPEERNIYACETTQQLNTLLNIFKTADNYRTIERNHGFYRAIEYLKKYLDSLNHPEPQPKEKTEISPKPTPPPPAAVTPTISVLPKAPPPDTINNYTPLNDIIDLAPNYPTAPPQPPEPPEPTPPPEPPKEAAPSRKIPSFVEKLTYKKEYLNKLNKILVENFPNGFPKDCPTSFSNFRFRIKESLPSDITFPIPFLKHYIENLGVLYQDVYHFVLPKTRDHIKSIVEEYFATGAAVIYFEEFYKKHLDWLAKEIALSNEILQLTLEKIFPDYLFPQKPYFTTSDLETQKILEQEISRVWGDIEEQTYSQISEKLTYIPLETIKETLEESKNFMKISDDTFKQGRDPFDFFVPLTQIITTHYQNGFDLQITPELSKIKEIYEAEYNEKMVIKDEDLLGVISTCGLYINKKIYVIQDTTKNKIKDLITEVYKKGFGLIYITEFFQKNEVWLKAGSVATEAILQIILSDLFPDYIYEKDTLLSLENQNRFKEINGELLLIMKDIMTLWHTSDTNYYLDVEKIKSELYFIPSDKIVPSINTNNEFLFNNQTSYIYLPNIQFDKKEIDITEKAIEKAFATKGSLPKDKIPITKITKQYPKITKSILIDLVYEKHYKDKFKLEGKNIHPLIPPPSLQEIVELYLEEIEKCDINDVLSHVQIATAKPADKPKIIEILSKTMIPISRDIFINKAIELFDKDIIKQIDEAINNFITDDYLPIKSFKNYESFPKIDTDWNLYLLESYCSGYSKLFTIKKPEENHLNIGVIVKKKCKLKYVEILADAVSKAKIHADNEKIGAYLYKYGYICSKKDKIIKKII